MVRRFYATLEVNMVNETIKWMTGKGKFKATFREFPCACGLDYDLTKGGAQMKELPEVKEDECNGTVQIIRAQVQKQSPK
jgi:hypothetical protein